MADFNQNFVTNNVTVESDEMIKFINPFESHQQHQFEDFSLFLNAFKKCRCCFSKLINESDQHTVEPWHRQAFLALTGVEMMTPDSENFLCMKCAKILKVYSELGKSAANLHRKYNVLVQDLAKDIKTERDESNKISRLEQDHNLYSDIVKSDYEVVSYDNQQPKQTNIMQNEIIFDGDISMEERIDTFVNSARLNKCTVRLTRINPGLVDEYEYYSTENTGRQTIDKTTNVYLNSIKCHICGKNSKSLNGLKGHLRYHHNKLKLSCDFCGKTFLTKQSIYKHMNIYHMNFKSSCNLCSAEFESGAKLLDHKLNVHYHRDFKCEDCDAAFGLPSLLSKHVKEMHGGKRWYCHYQDCSSSFTLRRYATRHFRITHKLQEGKYSKYLKTDKNDHSCIVKCQICGMIVKHRTALHEHFRNTHHAKTMRFSCDLCGATFSHLQKTDLIDHMYTLHMKAKFKCNWCPAEFQSNLKLFFHERNSHKKIFQCVKCDASFIEHSGLKEHVKVQHDGKQFNCPVPGCSKSYSVSTSAKRHLKDNHSLNEEEYRKYSAKVNPFTAKSEKDSLNYVKCEICGKITMNRKALIKHISRSHNKNKSCDFCGKTYSNKLLLIEHMETYHMELKFKCDLCSLELRSNKKLIDHKKVAHYKNFKCKECDAAFSFASLLSEHIEIKHEGKLYHCSYPGCSISLETKLKASRHLVVVHALMGDNLIKFNQKLTLQHKYQTSATNAELKRTSHKVSETNETLNILKKSQNETKCHLCGKTSKSLNGLKAHIRDHHNRPRVSCDLCGKQFARKQSIPYHIFNYHKLGHKRIVHDKNFECEDCDATFGKESLLSEHIKVMHDGKRWYCHYQDCSSSLSLKRYAIRHLQRFHSLHGEDIINQYLKTEKNDQSKIKCQICGMISKNQTVLYEHFRNTHTYAPRFFCDLCGPSFSHKQKSDLIDHMNTHHMKKVKFSCSLCPAEFQSNFKLNCHEKNAHNKKFKCEKCDASYIYPGELKEHVKVHHEGKLYHCQVPGCLRSYPLIRSARRHMLEYHSLKGDEYKNYLARLNSKFVSEKKEDNLKCQICGKIFKSRSNLLCHISRVHNKNMSCDFCGQTFSNKMNLVDHMQTHHMDLQFKCDLCSLELRSEKKLKAHKRNFHDKNFKCEECTAAFGDPKPLEEHVKVKHEGKRYHCSYPGCSTSFAAISNTTKHLVLAHSLLGESFNKLRRKITLK